MRRASGRGCWGGCGLVMCAEELVADVVAVLLGLYRRMERSALPVRIYVPGEAE